MRHLVSLGPRTPCRLGSASWRSSGWRVPSCSSVRVHQLLQFAHRDRSSRVSSAAYCLQECCVVELFVHADSSHDREARACAVCACSSWHEQHVIYVPSVHYCLLFGLASNKPQSFGCADPSLTATCVRTRADRECSRCTCPDGAHASVCSISAHLSVFSRASIVPNALGCAHPFIDPTTHTTMRESVVQVRKE